MNYKAATQNIMTSFRTPLIIGLSGIIISTLLLAAYHFIFFKWCLSRRHMQQERNNNQYRGIKSNCCGVQEEILNKIPVISYSISLIDAFGLDQGECSICLGELEDGDLVRVLPHCNHVFHIPCIDAWFKEHASCPFCRSQITCDIEESMVPIASENCVQQSVLHETTPSNHQQQHHHHNSDHRLMDDYVSSSTSTSRFQLRHSLSISSHVLKKSRVMAMGLKRSLSMNIAITIQRDQEMASTSCSSSTKWVVMRQHKYKSKSLKHVDQMSSVLMRSLSQLRNNSNRSGRSNLAILPN